MRERLKDFIRVVSNVGGRQESRVNGNSRLKRWRATGSRWLISEDEGETEGFYKGGFECWMESRMNGNSRLKRWRATEDNGNSKI
ncbi:hypothetical protein VitviT2T_019532 [Vitis vinifera]|uniref:Uncharacterized protein n=1 Tax=Vitis vinifera TaxID=29760 RepID=A0ABY9D2V4_VITVI|nr:hypothetical protein VitviT2T_019532 [Vitis vinifera]